MLAPNLSKKICGSTLAARSLIALLIELLLRDVIITGPKTPADGEEFRRAHRHHQPALLGAGRERGTAAA